MSSQASLNFSLEDTTGGCYRDITTELLARGWNRVSYKRRSKLERKRFPAREQPHAVWTLNEKDIDFKDLDEEQVCNHFEGITALTTKRGFCDLLRDMCWDSEDADDISPRCYNLGDPIHRDEFIDDFRLVAAMNIIKWYLQHNDKSVCVCSTCFPQPNGKGPANNNQSDVHTGRKSGWTAPAPILSSTLKEAYTPSAALQYVQQAVVACLWQIRVAKYGEWPNVDISRYFRDRETALEEGQWCALLDFSYDLAELRCECSLRSMLGMSDLRSYGTAGQSFHPFLFKLQTILHTMGQIRRQYAQIDGYKNIWVIKAPDSSCGIGIKVLSRLNDILQCEKGMGGRTVQKYIELPLLASIPSAGKIDLSTGSVKFDTRIWVLVTSFQPLQAHIFPIIYGRRCGTAYSTELASLGDSYAHLTNYSVQKKQSYADQGTGDGHSGGSGGGSGGGSCRAQTPIPVSGDSASSGSAVFDAHAAGKLRSALRKYRSNHSSSNSSSYNISSGSGNLNQTSSSGKGGLQQQQTAKGPQRAESDLLMAHQEILDVLRSRYAAYQADGASCLARSVLQRIGQVQDVWADYVWPAIKQKVLATLTVASREVVHRPRTFEFLGYDVIFDAALEPWVLEVNMSPAMAHRSPEQSSLIETMCKGLLQVAVYPHFDCPAQLLGPSADTGEVTNLWEPLGPAASGVNVESSADVRDATEEAISDTPRAPLNDWDEIPPPDGQIRPPKGSALLKKYSGMSSRASPGATTADLYFQKFIDAATSAAPSMAVGAGGVRPAGAKDTTMGRSVPNLIAVGTAIAETTIATIDCICVGADKLRALKRWWKKHSAKLRIYNELRRQCATKIQCLRRSYAAKQATTHLRHLRAAVVLQCAGRRWVAKRTLQRRRQEKAATAIQRIVRGRLGRLLYARKRADRSARRLQRWLKARLESHRVRSVTTIVLCVRHWLARRQLRARRERASRCVAQLAAAAPRNRLRRLLRWWHNETVDRDAYRTCNRRILSRCAAEKAQRKERQRQLAVDNAIAEAENSGMDREEQAMLQHLAFIDAVDFIQEVVEDAFDNAWLMIRKLRLSRRRLVKQPASSKLATSSAVPAAASSSPKAADNDMSRHTRTDAPSEYRVRWRETLVEARSPDSACSPVALGSVSSRTPDVEPSSSVKAPELRDEFVFSSADALLEQALAQTDTVLNAHTIALEASMIEKEQGALHHMHAQHSSTHTIELQSPESRHLPDEKVLTPVSETAQAKLISSARQGDPVKNAPAKSSQGEAEAKQQKRPARRAAMVGGAEQAEASAPLNQVTPEERKDVAPAALERNISPVPPPIASPAPPASPKVIIAHRRPRVSRPHVEYIGQYPVGTLPESGAPEEGMGGHNTTQHAHPYNTKFTAAQSAATVHTGTAADLDTAIEQASFLNIQSILSRRPSAGSMPVRPYQPDDASSVTNGRSSLVAQEPSEWEMEHTHTELRRGGENMAFAMDPETILGLHAANQPGISMRNDNSAVPEQLRRSFEPQLQATKANNGVHRNRVDDKLWYSFDRSASPAINAADAARHNESWLLFLMRKRELEAQRDISVTDGVLGGGTGRPQRPHSSHSSSASRPGVSFRGTRGGPMSPPRYAEDRQPSPRRHDYATSLRQYGSPFHASDSERRESTSPRRKEWSFDEPSRHYEAKAPRPRPVSAGTTSVRGGEGYPYGGVGAVPGCPSLSDALAEAMEGLAGYSDTPQVADRDIGPSGAAPGRNGHPRPRSASTARGAKSKKSNSGSRSAGTQKARHREVKERIVKTYAI